MLTHLSGNGKKYDLHNLHKKQKKLVQNPSVSTGTGQHCPCPTASMRHHSSTALRGSHQIPTYSYAVRCSCILRRSWTFAPPPNISILLSRLNCRGPTKPRWLYAGMRPPIIWAGWWCVAIDFPLMG